MNLSIRICECWCTKATAFSNPVGYTELRASDPADMQHLFTRVESDAVNGQALCGVHYIMNWTEAAKDKQSWKHALACRWAERTASAERGRLCIKCQSVAADKVAAGMKNEEMY